MALSGSDDHRCQWASSPCRTASVMEGLQSPFRAVLLCATVRCPANGFGHRPQGPRRDHHSAPPHRSRRHIPLTWVRAIHPACAGPPDRRAKAHYCPPATHSRPPVARRQVVVIASSRRRLHQCQPAAIRIVHHAAPTASSTDVAMLSAFTSPCLLISP